VTARRKRLGDLSIAYISQPRPEAKAAALGDARAVSIRCAALEKTLGEAYDYGVSVGVFDGAVRSPEGRRLSERIRVLLGRAA
jgi:hypothetical protein